MPRVTLELLLNRSSLFPGKTVNRHELCGLRHLELGVLWMKAGEARTNVSPARHRDKNKIFGPAVGKGQRAYRSVGALESDDRARIWGQRDLACLTPIARLVWDR